VKTSCRSRFAPIQKRLWCGEVQGGARAVLDVELADCDQSITLLEWQASEHDCVNDGEYCRRRTDTQRQQNQRDYGECR
jgi:hypothetical protein